MNNLSSNNRIEYFDALRGIMIILVVYSHLVTFVLKPNMDIPDYSILNNFFASFRMPLFFFISGFFLYSKQYSKDLYRKRAKNRILRQLYPTILIGTLYSILILNKSPLSTLSDEAKGGYWFTITAVVFFFLIAPLLVISSSFPHKYKIGNQANNTKNIIIILYTVLVVTISFILSKVVPSYIKGIFGLSYIFLYFPFFIFGVLFKANYEIIHQVLYNKSITLLCILCYILCYFLVENNLNKYFLGFSAIIVIHNLILYFFSFKKVKLNKIVTWLKSIGTMTLEIYLLHYFFVKMLFRIQHEVNFSFLRNQINNLSEFPITIFMSLLVIGLCIGVVKVMKTIKIYNIFFPQGKMKLTSQALSIKF